MQRITQTSIKNLMGERDEPVLTLYVPTHRFPTPPNIQEDQTRFKNLVREGCRKWTEEADEAIAEARRHELEAHIDDLQFWQDMIETLAVFVSREGIEMYSLPIECSERVCVSSRFDLTPLLLTESINQPCYVFALATHESKLFKADLYGIEPIEVDFPKSPEDALNIDEMFSGSNTIRGGGGRQSGANSTPAAPHGQGDSNGAGQEERLIYLRMLDDKIHTMKDFDDSLPLIIAATDTEFGDFRSISRSKNIIDVHIPGNHTASTPEELHQLVTTLLFETLIKQKQQHALDRLGELRGVNRSSTDLADITIAATEGRVECLLVPMIDMTTDSVSDTDEHRPLVRYNDQFNDGIFDSVCATAGNGGQIIAVERGSLSGMASIGAIYRY